MNKALTKAERREINRAAYAEVCAAAKAAGERASAETLRIRWEQERAARVSALLGGGVIVHHAPAAEFVAVERAPFRPPVVEPPTGFAPVTAPEAHAPAKPTRKPRAAKPAPAAETHAEPESMPDDEPGARVTFRRDSFLKAAAWLAGCVARLNTIPILACARFTREGGELSVRATDMEIAGHARVQLAATGARILDCVAPLGEVVAFVRGCPAGSVVILNHQPSQDGAGMLQIRCGDMVAAVVCHALADYPGTEPGPMLPAMEYPAATLARWFPHFATHASTEQTRYYLNGALLETSRDGVRLVATDGHRLLWARIGDPAPDSFPRDPKGEPVGPILPTIFLKVAARMLAKRDGSALLSVSETRARLECGGDVLVTKLIDGTFPEYRRVVPTVTDTAPAWNADAAELIRIASAARRLCRGQKSSPIRFQSHADGSIIADARSEADATATYPSTARANSAGVGIAVGVQAQYLAEMAAAMGGAVTWYPSDKDGPMVFDDPNNPDMRGVIMPMRV